jgi:dephospho-CoA kinase
MALEVQLKPAKLIGVTGSIASGKSAFCDVLAACGAVVIDADVLAREVVEPNSPASAAIRARFGDTVFCENSLDRKALAKIIFSNPEEKRWLEQLLHPEIRALFVARLAAARAQQPPPPLIVYVAPLLFEAGVPNEIEQVVLVTAPEQLLIERATKRGLPRDEAIARLRAQMSDGDKRQRADIVIENASDLPSLADKARELFKNLRGA